MDEHFFQCPYCWEEISFLLDSSVPRQTYVEDCEVCCNPIEVSLTFEEQELIAFEARELGQ
ncbi:CPXCG motif-containing cysteine-rich protein [Flagellimonas baculiformis]|uniref:CPXCG motif-containing cysteine-rich protein n=1 Tax=Flagellimonas baculiformis TaxID=3067310 RepID=UPI00296FAD16|nr:CPXCG motif-containing cysteine-rich protein [Muricauda sp. D6]